MWLVKRHICLTPQTSVVSKHNSKFMAWVSMFLHHSLFMPTYLEFVCGVTSHPSNPLTKNNLP
jgi:hypothetical protein